MGKHFIIVVNDIIMPGGIAFLGPELSLLVAECPSLERDPTPTKQWVFPK